MKISFIIPAHDEENNIGKAIAYLYEFPYKNYEVIIGLDNCHDKTLSIVNQMCMGHPNFKYKVFKERQGKAQMITEIIKELDTDIIIVQDADWRFDYGNELDVQNLLDVFKEDKVRGIADPYPVSYPPRKDASILETGSSLYGQVWIDCVKNHAQYYCNGYKKLDPDYFPGLVNIFRKDSFTSYGNETLADDFERAIDIMSDGDAVLISTAEDPIRMKTAGEQYTIKGMFSQKKRTALARQQLGKLYPDLNMKIPKWDLIKSIWRNVIKPCNIKYIWSFGVVTVLFLLGNIFKPKDISTKDGWNLRAR